MGRLSGFQEFVLDRKAVLEGVEARLCAIQEHYETFYGEVAALKEHELDQLAELIQRERTRLPDWLTAALAEVGPRVEREVDERIAEGERALAQARGRAEELRDLSRREEERIHRTNAALDAQEERLKARNEELLARIDEYNRRIREASTGFGFLLNLPAMRRLRRERRALDREHADLEAHIERLRSRWAEAEAGYTEEERERQETWEAAATAAAEQATVVQWLRESRERVIYRTTLERAVAEGPAPDARGGPGGRCSRCGYTNPSAALLCRVCGRRLGEDRPDLEGSLAEVAEAIRVHGDFAEGMRACQEIIGLVRGLVSGHEAFARSVADMIETERKYPVGDLEIDVPETSVAHGRIFDELRQALDGTEHLHPLDLGQFVEEMLAGRLAEGAIQAYFETMGEELSRCAEAQW